MKQFIKHKIPLGYTSTFSTLDPILPLGDYIFELDLVVRDNLNNYNYNIGNFIVDYYMNDYYLPDLSRHDGIIYVLRYLEVNDPPEMTHYRTFIKHASDKIHIIHHNRL